MLVYNQTCNEVSLDKCNEDSLDNCNEDSLDKCNEDSLDKCETLNNQNSYNNELLLNNKTQELWIDIMTTKFKYIYDPNIYIPSRLLPSNTVINNFYSSGLKSKRYIYFDYYGVMGDMRNVLDDVVKDKVSREFLIPLFLKNLDVIVKSMNEYQQHQQDIIYFLQLADNRTIGNIQLMIYMLMKGEFNTNFFGCSRL